MAFVRTRHRGRPGRALGAGLAAVLLATCLGLVTGAGPASAVPSSPTLQASADPILFVHGWNNSAAVWNTMIDRFVAAGYPRNRLLAISYNSNQSNAAIANQVRDSVNALRAQTGAAKVDIITHSMGGLSSRYYLRNLGGTAFVDEWVSLGGPNHGTLVAWACVWFSASCWDMLPGSAFLNALNAGDETPGATNYGTWWSSADEIINPRSSVPLAGATNNPAGAIAHGDFLVRDDVFQAVRAFVA